MVKFVYLFREGNARMRDLLGGKGANLCEMTRLGLPVPPGFVITTQACNYYSAHKKFPSGLKTQIKIALTAVEKKTGKKFGDEEKPLLLSVRSGSKFSMPGMMDTILNLGLNDVTVKTLSSLTGSERFAYDAYRRLISMFGRIVKGVEGRKFEAILDAHKVKTRGGKDSDLDAKALKQIVKEYKVLYKKEVGEEFPRIPEMQLEEAIIAVFGSWTGKRAVDYRNFHGISHDLGTAANVQTMVFGNIGSDSGTGVAFTRDPATGDRVLYGEYLSNAQGEDVVAGIRTPMKISQLKASMPKIYSQLQKISKLLEKHYKDIQDVEFTVEDGKLWMLQTRTAKRTAAAAVRIAAEMVREKLISKEEAVLRVTPDQVIQLLMPVFGERAKTEARNGGRFLAKGLNASPGAASGLAAFDPDTAEAWGKEGKPVILVRTETSPDDVHGMLLSKGVLTAHGGATSHAAVVARGLGIACVAGCETIDIDEEARAFVSGQITIREGDTISIDGSSGEVFAGSIPTVEREFEKENDLKAILGWADDCSHLQVWANADYPRDAEKARKFGAKGIGLCRTEHMFFETERLPIVQEMILAKKADERKAALNRLLPIQKSDLEGLFQAMKGLPVVIRLIDPPLHEFLPSYESVLIEVTKLRMTQNEPSLLKNTKSPEDSTLLKEVLEAGSGDLASGIKILLSKKQSLLHAISNMKESNPMMGLRGCRLGITVPEITQMQVRAIFEAACDVKKSRVDVHPEVMIPLVGHANELRNERNALEAVAKKVMKERKVKLDYKFGTMIEIPRAALTADEIAKHADFFSFGTNDLTQMTFGFSRDDAESKFLLRYIDMGILSANPFQVLDRTGVGALMKNAVTKGRKSNPNLKIGICGEHGGEPNSIEFCHEVGLDYVSCSPFRVPVARLAAAHANLKGKPSIDRGV